MRILFLAGVLCLVGCLPRAETGESAPTSAPAAAQAGVSAELAAIDWAKVLPGATDEFDKAEVNKIVRLAKDPKVLELSGGGDAAAQTVRAWSMLYGNTFSGPPPSTEDREAAEQMLVAADAKGFPPAIYLNGVSHGSAGCASYLARAADLNFAPAYFPAGLCVSVTDVARGATYLRRAADAGQRDAGAYLAGHLARIGDFSGGTLAQDDIEAVRLLRQAVERNSQIAKGLLGYMTEMGRGGIVPDREAAIVLYRDAADDGSNGDHIFALEQLKRLGVETDPG